MMSMTVQENIRAALFDLDGVVFDTESQYSVFWGEQCRLYHPDKPGLEDKIKGQTLVQIFDKYFSELKGEQPVIVRRLDEFERNMKFEYVPGFLDFVTALRGKGVKTVNGTGNLYVTVEIDVPVRLSRDQQKKLGEYEDSVSLRSCENMSRFANNVSAIYGKNINKQ